MGNYDIDKDLYVKWLEEKTIAIEAMTTREEIESRIVEISKIEFFAKREWALLHAQYDKITGRKGIAPWLKEERDKLITDPDIKVNWDGEPRKKEKKPKQDLVKNLLGIDMKDAMREIREREKNPERAKDLDMNDIIGQLANAVTQPKEEPAKATREEIEAKAAALKEKIRLAKEAAKG
jgi:hypothetical protein